MLCALQLFDIADRNLSLIFSIGFLISLVGLVDDKYELNTGGKLSLQIIPIFYLVVFENITLNEIGTYGGFKVELGTFVIPFTLICVLFLINAFNYFDGIDGTLGLTSISTLINIFLLIEDQDLKFFLIAIVIPVTIFLCFNFSFFKLPKLFLGDSGSLFLGFVISFVLIYFSNQNFSHPILLAWSVVIFVYEFLSINLIRIKNKRDPFQPGQDHLHHILFKRTKSIFFTNFIIFFANTILFLIGYFSFLFFSSLTSLILFVCFFMIFLYLRNKS